MADTILNIIKITGILNQYAWQNHELSPEELFQLLAGRRRVIEANRDRIAEIDGYIKDLASRPEEEKKSGDVTEEAYQKIHKSEETLVLEKYSEAWRFPVAVNDILGLMQHKLGDSVTKDTVVSALDSLAYSPAQDTQEYRLKVVNATALKTWGVAEENVAWENAQGWAAILDDVLDDVLDKIERLGATDATLKEDVKAKDSYLQEIKKFKEFWNAEKTAVTVPKGKIKKLNKKKKETDNKTGSTPNDSSDSTNKESDMAVQSKWPYRVDSVVKLNSFLEEITKNEIQREEIKREIRKLRNTGMVTQRAADEFDRLLSDTLSYAQELENQHLQDRIKTFKVLNDAAYSYYLDQKFLKDKSRYRKNDVLNEAVRAGFAGEDAMSESDKKQLYTFSFVQNLLHVAQENGIDLAECFLPAKTPDGKDFKEILKKVPQPKTEEDIEAFAKKTSSEFQKHLQEIKTDVIESVQVLAEEGAWPHVCLLLRKLLTSWLKCMYRARYFAFYVPEMDLQKKQYLYYLIRGSELLSDKDRLLLLQAVETGIPDQRVKQRIQYFLQKDLSITVQEKLGTDYGSQMQDDNKKRTEQGGDLSEINEKIRMAIKDKHKLLFEYCYVNEDGELETKKVKPKYGKKLRTKIYEAFPFGIVYQAGYFYMLAFFDSGKTKKVIPYTFRMDLMQNVEIKEYSGRRRQINEIVSFEKETVFDEEKYKKKHPHMYGDEKKNNKERDGGIETGDDGTIIFRVHKDYVRYFTYAFGEHCKKLETEGGNANENQEVKIQLDTTLGEAKIFALQYAPYCKVLSPGDLVRDLKKCVLGVAKKYGAALDADKNKQIDNEPMK